MLAADEQAPSDARSCVRSPIRWRGIRRREREAVVPGRASGRSRSGASTSDELSARPRSARLLFCEALAQRSCVRGGDLAADGVRFCACFHAIARVRRVADEAHARRVFCQTGLDRRCLCFGRLPRLLPVQRTASSGWPPTSAWSKRRRGVARSDAVLPVLNPGSLAFECPKGLAAHAGELAQSARGTERDASAVMGAALREVERERARQPADAVVQSPASRPTQRTPAWEGAPPPPRSGSLGSLGQPCPRGRAVDRGQGGNHG